MHARNLAVCLAFAAPVYAQLGTVSRVQSFQPPQVVVDVYSGHGAPGGDDSQVSVLAGPTLFGWNQKFTASEFAAARNGPPAYVLANPPWAIQGLTSHPGAQFIAPDAASETGASTVSGLFAIEFEVPTKNIVSASMDLYFSSDDYLGWNPNVGIFVNEKPVKGTESFFGWGSQFYYEGLKVGPSLRPGKNTLYAYLVNSGGPGGLLFHARIRINGTLANTCEQALPAYLGSNSGSTYKHTTSGTTGSCVMLNDRWYVFVPPETGTLDATLNSPIAGLTPALGAFGGFCGGLTPLGCSTATPPTYTGSVTAGIPVFFAVGGTTAATGNYSLDLEITPNQTGLVNPSNGHLYKKTATKTDFAGARAFATQQGGYLASVNDLAENDWIKSNLAANAAVWIGLTDEISEGNWQWESGEPFNFSSWNAGEPNDSATCNGEDYVEMLGGGLWNDLNTGQNPCGNHIRFGLVEIPAAGLAAVDDLGGSCGLNGFLPQLYSEAHKIGTIATMAVLFAEPVQGVVLFSSLPTSVPAPVGDCLVHLDPASSMVMGTSATNLYGSVAFTAQIPNDPLLIGQKSVWQAQLFPAAGGVSYSNAIESTLGN